MSRIFGFGAERIELPATASRQDVIRQRTVMLARCLNMGTTVAFVGAGCSIALGYPGWKTFVLHAIAAMKSTIASRGAEYASDAARIEQLQEQVDRSTSLTSDEYLVMLGICQRVANRMRDDGHGDPYA